ncbi:MAG: LEPR-XLL domain-containing protein, partial [Planctomycetes bacterium]|nr:LEPR-XLL domain-containing protein [Planctomycetota bacterium]
MSGNLFESGHSGLGRNSLQATRGMQVPICWPQVEGLEPRILLAAVVADVLVLSDEPLEIMPTSPFIVNPFIDPLVIPEALEPGWRLPDGTLAPDDPM